MAIGNQIPLTRIKLTILLLVIHGLPFLIDRGRFITVYGNYALLEITATCVAAGSIAKITAGCAV